MATIEITTSPHWGRVIELLKSSIENRAKKHVFLKSEEGSLQVYLVVTKKKDGTSQEDSVESPVITARFEIEGHANTNECVSLSSDLLTELSRLSDRSPSLLLEITETEITVNKGTPLEYSETRVQQTTPSLPEISTDHPCGTLSSQELAKALHAVSSAAGKVPDASNGTAFIGEGDFLYILAGDTTRRASWRIQGENAKLDGVQALCPQYFVSTLSSFLRKKNEEITIDFDGASFALHGGGDVIVLHRHTDFEVVAFAGSSSLNPSHGVNVRLSGNNVHDLRRVAEITSSFESKGVVSLSKDGEEIKAQVYFSDGGEWHSRIPVENVTGINGDKVSVAARDLKQALRSTHLVDNNQRIYMHTNGSASLSVTRTGDPNYAFDLSQIERKEYPLREKVGIYAAVSGQYDIIRRTVCKRILLSHHTLPPSIKADPSTFPAFLQKHGLMDSSGHMVKSLMIDNGAFSVKFGEHVDEGAFFAFIAANESYITQYTMNDFYYDTFDANVESYLRAKAVGLDPIYIFHMGENYDRLEKLLNGEFGFDVTRIGWGGAAVDTPEKRTAYVERAVSLIPDLSGIKIHGFGMVSQLDLLQSFPFDTADASTFAVWSKSRQIPTPWGLMSVRRDHKDSVHKHILRDEIKEWVGSLSYSLEDFSVEFTLDELSREDAQGTALRTLLALAFYDYMEEGFRYINYMRRELRFLPMDQLRQRESCVQPVSVPAVQSMNPIQLGKGENNE